MFFFPSLEWIFYRPLYVPRLFTISRAFGGKTILTVREGGRGVKWGFRENGTASRFPVWRERMLSRGVREWTYFLAKKPRFFVFEW